MLLGDGFVHEVDDVEDAAANVLLRGVCLLLRAYDVGECSFDSVGDACTGQFLKD